MCKGIICGLAVRTVNVHVNRNMKTGVSSSSPNVIVSALENDFLLHDSTISFNMDALHGATKKKKVPRN